MQLTPENYHSPEANTEYMSVSQWKLAMRCPAQWYARYVTGTYTPPSRKALDRGTLVHAVLLEPHTVEAVLERCKASLYTKSGPPTADTMRIIEAAQWIHRHTPLADIWAPPAKVEQIYTFTVAGMPWKAKMDIVRDQERECWDIKTTRGVHHTEYSTEAGRHVPWYIYYGYDLQLAVYQEALYQTTGEEYRMGLLPFVVPTETMPVPDCAVMHWEGDLQGLLDSVTRLVPYIAECRAGDGSGLRRCGRDDCDFCRRTKTEFDMVIGPVLEVTE